MDRDMARWPVFVTQAKVDALICGGIGGGAQMHWQKWELNFSEVFPDQQTRL